MNVALRLRLLRVVLVLVGVVSLAVWPLTKLWPSGWRPGVHQLELDPDRGLDAEALAHLGEVAIADVVRLTPPDLASLTGDSLAQVRKRLFALNPEIREQLRHLLRGTYFGAHQGGLKPSRLRVS